MYHLSLKRLPENGGTQEQALDLDLNALDLKSPFIAGPVPVAYSLRRFGDKVFGNLRASAKVELECGRCLKPFVQELQADFGVQFEPRSAAQAAERSEEDVDEDDTSLVYFDGDELPLGDEIRQELELLLPYAPVCREDCAGLCKVCGKDLNEGDCGCPRAEEGGAFAALNDLFKKPNP